MAFEFPIENPAIDEMAGFDQWVCFNSKKKPINTRTGVGADPTGRRTWTTFDKACQEAVQKRTNPDIQGVGFVFSDDDPYVGIDLDHCVKDGEIVEPWAKKIVETLNTYTEYSYSKTGVHCIIKGKIPIGFRSRNGKGVEIYEIGRYFITTFQPFPGTPETIEERQSQLESVYAEFYPTVYKNASNYDGFKNIDIKLDDSFLSFKKFMSLLNNHPLFKKSWEHKRPDLGSPSMSEFDFSLALIAANAEWSDQEIASLIIQHRQEHGDPKNKAYRLDYIQRQIERVREYQTGGIGDKEALRQEKLTNAKDLTDEDNLSVISAELGVDIDKVIKRGMDPPEFFFVIDGKEISLGPPISFLSYRLVAATIFGVIGKTPKTMKQEQWKDIANLCGQIAVFEESLDRESETIECIEQYLENKNIYREEEMKDALPNYNPFRKNGKVWVSFNKVFSFISKNKLLVKTEKRDLRSRFHTLQMENKTFSLKANGRVFCRGYWGIYADSLTNSKVHEEESEKQDD